jgi:hypothetical protein
MSQYIYFKNIYYGKDSLTGYTLPEFNLKFALKRGYSSNVLEYLMSTIGVLSDVSDIPNIGSLIGSGPYKELKMYSLLTNVAEKTGNLIVPILIPWDAKVVLSRLSRLYNLGNNVAIKTENDKELVTFIISQLKEILDQYVLHRKYGPTYSVNEMPFDRWAIGALSKIIEYAYDHFSVIHNDIMEYNYLIGNLKRTGRLVSLEEFGQIEKATVYV